MFRLFPLQSATVLWRISVKNNSRDFAIVLILDEFYSQDEVQRYLFYQFLGFPRWFSLLWPIDYGCIYDWELLGLPSTFMRCLWFISLLHWIINYGEYLWRKLGFGTYFLYDSSKAHKMQNYLSNSTFTKF